MPRCLLLLATDAEEGRSVRHYQISEHGKVLSVQRDELQSVQQGGGRDQGVRQIQPVACATTPEHGAGSTPISGVTSNTRARPINAFNRRRSLPLCTPAYSSATTTTDSAGDRVSVGTKPTAAGR